MPHPTSMQTCRSTGRNSRSSHSTECPCPSTIHHIALNSRLIFSRPPQRGFTRSSHSTECPWPSTIHHIALNSRLIFSCPLQAEWKQLSSGPSPKPERHFGPFALTRALTETAIRRWFLRTWSTLHSPAPILAPQQTTPSCRFPNHCRLL